MSTKTLPAIAVALAAATSVNAASTLTPYTLATTTYFQDFNSLSTSTTASQVLPAGFQISETGSNGDDAYVAATGSNGTGGIFSFATTAAPADRALGSIGSGSITTALYGGIFTNGLGSTITSLTFDYFGEQYRFAGNTADQLFFDFFAGATAVDNAGFTEVASLAFVAPRLGATTEMAVDGNATANRTRVTGTIIGLSIAAGTTFGFRFRDLNSTGNDQGLAVDDLTLTATTARAAAVPEPASWAMMVAGFGLLGGAMRRRRPVAFA